MNIITKTGDEWHSLWNTRNERPEHRMKAPNALTSARDGPRAAILFVPPVRYRQNGPTPRDITRPVRCLRKPCRHPAGRARRVKTKPMVWCAGNSLRCSLEFRAGYSRQGNLYAGDFQNTNTNDLVKENYGKRDQQWLVPQHIGTRNGARTTGDQQLGQYGSFCAKGEGPGRGAHGDL